MHCLIMLGKRDGQVRGGKPVSSRSPLQSMQQMSAISWGTEINDASSLFFTFLVSSYFVVSLALLSFL